MSRLGQAVSVLMAVYNGERFLPKAVDSVLSQTFDDFEFLIVDDGSSDDTPEILARYARQDSRIVLHRIAHTGRSGALNFGCERARTGLIARLDADDIALPKRLEQQLRFLRENQNVALLGGAARLINENGEVYAEDAPPTGDAALRKALERLCPFYHSNVVFRKRAVEEVGGYRAVFEPAEDYDLWLRISEQNSVASLADPVGHYRFWSEQESIRLVEAQAIGLVAARAAAKERRDGRTERMAAARTIDAETLAAAGVEMQELDTALVHLAAWYAENLSRAGDPGAAHPLWETAVAGAPALPPRVRSEVNRRIALYRS